MKVIIIGGGFAGLSAAYHSSLAGMEVELHESSFLLGGLWRPILSDKYQYPIDNGQHLLSETYSDTIEFFSASGADKLFANTGRLNINFIEKGKKFKLNTTLLPSPYGELLGILNYKKLDFKSKISIIKFIRNLKNNSPDRISTAEDYLIASGQSANAILYFWEPIIVSACNAKPSMVSAEIFHNMLTRIFTGKGGRTSLLIPKVSIRYIINQLESILLKQNVEIYRDSRITKFNIQNGRIISAETSNKEILTADMFILATIIKQNSLLEEVLDFKRKLYYSGIISGYFLYDRPIMKEPYVSLLGANLQWIFAENNEGEDGFLYKLTVSAANELLSKDSKSLIEIFEREIKENISGAKDAVLKLAKLSKTTNATPEASPAFQFNRIKTSSKYENLFFAGAHIDTGLPITIESAVKSGKIAVNEILKTKQS